jgi:hypothetical protein
MTDDRSFERSARSWLEDGPTRAPDRAMETALLRIETTTQERDWHVPRRVRSMSLIARVAAAAITVAIVVGVVILRPGGTNVGGVQSDLRPSEAIASPTSSAATSSSPAPAVPTPTPLTLATSDSNRTLQAGTYRADGFAVPVSVTLPAGWTTNGFAPHDLVLHNDTDNTFLAIVVMASVYPDPCHTEGSPNAVKPGVDALVNALSTMHGFRIVGVKNVTVGGASGKSFTLTNSIDLKAARCSSPDVLWIGRDGDNAPVLETPGSDALSVVDASGTTLLIGGPAVVVNSLTFGGTTN